MVRTTQTLTRDAMFATLMIVLNGMVGAALLMGPMRYWEQEYNLAGARAFLVVIASLAVFALIVPELHQARARSERGASEGNAVRLDRRCLLLWVVFVIVQTVRHRAFYAEPAGNGHGYVKAIARRRIRGPLGEHVAMLPAGYATCQSCCWRNSSP